jgi:hypothetical protein
VFKIGFIAKAVTHNFKGMKSENRLRFDNIHSHNAPNSLEEVYYRLSINDITITDEQILNRYLKFSDAIQTNTFAAAELEWVTVSVLCYYRPNLTPALIKRGLLCVIYSIGDEIDASGVFRFINNYVLARGVEPYGGLPPEAGVVWLSQILPTQIDLIQIILDEMIAQNRLELGDV